MSIYETKCKRSCVNCVHLNQPVYAIGNFSLGGCRDRLSRNGPPSLRLTYCGQFFPKQLTEEDY